MSASRAKFRNPSPPPGYKNAEKPQLRLKDGLMEIDGEIFQFILPMIEAGLFESTTDFSKFVVNSDSEDEEDGLEIPADEEEYPIIVIEDSDSSSEHNTEAELHDLSNEQVQAVNENCESSTYVRKVKSTVVKNSRNKELSELSSRKTPRKVVEEETRRIESSIVQRKMGSPKNGSTGKASPKRRTSRNGVHCKKKAKERRTSRNEEWESCSIVRSTVTVCHGRKRSSKRNCDQGISPRRKASRKINCESYNSDHNTHSGYKEMSPKKEQKPSCSGYESSEDRKISMRNEEVVNENLFGRYHCRYCNATMNSRATFETHLIGKRHKKNVKLKNIVENVHTIQPIQVESKYPPPPPGICRIRVDELSYIQDIVERSITKPCPGLDNVIEIRGIAETMYFCELCAAPCSTASIMSHLNGYRHLLRTLKHFDYERYECIRDRKKFEVERKLGQWLADIERYCGRGRIVVEKEIPVKKDPHGNLSPKSEWRKMEDISGPSYRDPEDSFPQDYASTTIPDTSKSDFYCKICDSHMNNLDMWEMHVRGKRHLANVVKAPGELPTKSRTILVPNARAKIMDEIDFVQGPVVGLNEMREVQNPEAPGELYTCFLCGACLSRRDVVEHILSLKHRKKYLEKINHPDIMTINHLNILDRHMCSVIEETCFNVEAEMGRGNMEVHVVKSALTGVKF